MAIGWHYKIGFGFILFSTTGCVQASARRDCGAVCGGSSGC